MSTPLLRQPGNLKPYTTEKSVSLGKGRRPVDDLNRRFSRGVTGFQRPLVLRIAHPELTTHILQIASRADRPDSRNCRLADRRIPHRCWIDADRSAASIVFRHRLPQSEAESPGGSSASDQICETIVLRYCVGDCASAAIGIARFMTAFDISGAGAILRYPLTNGRPYGVHPADRRGPTVIPEAGTDGT
jgi:hypothetical protein